VSTSSINCPKCRKPVATKHHGSAIRVRKGVGVVILHTGVLLSSNCGQKRLVTLSLSVPTVPGYNGVSQCDGDSDRV
jgi:hypothetical protein